jgi:TusA-related sulfurtransferase
MAPGTVLEVRLNEGEPLINVPRSAAEMGHLVLSQSVEEGSNSIYRLRIAIT